MAVIIAPVSDSHFHQKSPSCSQRLLDFEVVMDDIDSLTPQPDLIIHSGNIP